MKVPRCYGCCLGEKTYLHVLSFYKYQASEASEKKKKENTKKNNSNILCLLLKKKEVGLVVKFYISLSQ